MSWQMGGGDDPKWFWINDGQGNPQVPGDNSSQAVAAPPVVPPVAPTTPTVPAPVTPLPTYSQNNEPSTNPYLPAETRPGNTGGVVDPAAGNIPRAGVTATGNNPLYDAYIANGQRPPSAAILPGYTEGPLPPGTGAISFWQDPANPGTFQGLPPGLVPGTSLADALRVPVPQGLGPNAWLDANGNMINNAIPNAAAQGYVDQTGLNPYTAGQSNNPRDMNPTALSWLYPSGVPWGTGNTNSSATVNTGNTNWGTYNPNPGGTNVGGQTGGGNTGGGTTGGTGGTAPPAGSGTTTPGGGTGTTTNPSAGGGGTTGGTNPGTGTGGTGGGTGTGGTGAGGTGGTGGTGGGTNPDDHPNVDPNAAPSGFTTHDANNIYSSSQLYQSLVNQRNSDGTPMSLYNALPRPSNVGQVGRYRW